MAPRATWKGFLNLSLVSVPVKAYSATDSGGTVRLNQLHADCNSRVNYKTVCPACGEISRSDIVKGYEFAKDQYVVIDLEELEKLRAKDENRAIRIESFIDPAQIDPLYLSDTSYYLVPDGAAGQKPFALLCEAMKQKKLSCVAQVVLHNKDQLVVVRPVGGLLCMTVLRYASQVKAVETFDDELTDTEVSKSEYQLAETLIGETTIDEFDIAAYEDKYTSRLNQLIDSKVEGKELVTAPSVEAPPVINLMDALKASVAKVQGGDASDAPIMKKVARRKTKSTEKTASKARQALSEKLASPKKKKTTKRKKKAV